MTGVPKIFLAITLMTIRIPSAGSLKDRRHVVKSLIDLLRKRLNVSVSDLGPDNTWDLAYIAVASVTSSAKEAESLLDAVERSVLSAEAKNGFEIINFDREVEYYGQIKVERVNKEMMREISEFLLNNTKDPTLKKAVITEVRCTNDLSLAKVYFTSIDKSELEEIGKSLNNLAGP